MLHPSISFQRQLVAVLDPCRFERHRLAVLCRVGCKQLSDLTQFVIMLTSPA